MAIPATNFAYFWDTLVNPRLGHAGHAPDSYVWGGSFSRDDINQGTDCSGAVSAELSAMVRGPGCIYQRQFYTGTFAGANPGDHGPWGGVDDTRDLVCIASPGDAPFGAAMIIAIRQMADPTDAHMICSVPTSVGGPWTTIEMGGPPDNYHLGVTAIDNPEFNQWFYLPGPILTDGAPPPPVLSRTDRYALAVIVEGKKRGISPRGIQIALTVPFVESGWKIYSNVNVPGSEGFPHDAVGQDHDSTGLFQQRQAWGPLACTMDPSCSAGLFYDGGAAGQRGLTDFDYNSDARTPGGWAQAVQVSQFPDRYDEHWGEALDLFNRLAGVLPPPPPPPPPQSGEDMALVPQDEWNQLRDAFWLFWHTYMDNEESLSPVRHVGEGAVLPLHRAIRNIDGSVHLIAEILVGMLLRFPDPDALALLNEVANVDVAQHPERTHDRKLAKAILLGLKTSPTAAATQTTSTPVTVITPTEVLPAIREPQTVAVQGNTPEDLIAEVKRLTVFDEDYNKVMQALRLGASTPDESGAK